MVSTKVTALLGAAVYATSAFAADETTSDTMGPAAMLWPPDRVWSDAADNTGPCGSNASPGERTSFPMTNGRIALVSQDTVRAMHVGVSYKSNPTVQDDFEIFYDPNEIGTLGVGHTCIPVPDAPATVKAGDSATFSILYMSETDEIHYACSDITFVELSAFDEAIPCFNATIEDPEIKIDGSVDVTTTDDNGDTPHTVSDFTSDSSSDNTQGTTEQKTEEKASGPAAGTIAGAVVGGLAALGLVGAAAWFWRRKAAQKKEQEQMRQVDAEKANSDTLSTRS